MENAFTDLIGLGAFSGNCLQAVRFVVEHIREREMRDLLKQEKAIENFITALGAMEKMFDICQKFNCTPAELQRYFFLMILLSQTLASMRAPAESKKTSTYSQLRIPSMGAPINYFAGKYFSRKLITA